MIKDLRRVSADNIVIATQPVYNGVVRNFLDDIKYPCSLASNLNLIIKSLGSLHTTRICYKTMFSVK